MAPQLLEKELNTQKFNDSKNSQILGLEEILKLSKKLNIYEEIPELLSVSLGAAETTLINLTSACSICKWREKDWTNIDFKNSR